MKWFFSPFGLWSKEKKIEGIRIRNYSRYFTLFCTFHFHGTAVSVGAQHWTLLFLSSQLITGSCCLVAKLCLTLCNPMDCSLSGSSVHGTFQARILEWVAISFSRGSSKLRDPTRSPALAGGFFTTDPPGNPVRGNRHVNNKVGWWCASDTHHIARALWKPWRLS